MIRSQITRTTILKKIWVSVHRLLFTCYFCITRICHWFDVFCFCFASMIFNFIISITTAGSIKTYQSLNSLATSLATSFAVSMHSNDSDDSERSTEVTRL